MNVFIDFICVKSLRVLYFFTEIYFFAILSHLTTTSYSNSTSTTVLSKHMAHTHKINVNVRTEDLKQQKLTDIFLSSSNAFHFG